MTRRIETARLLLRAPRLADVPALFTFMGDPTSMRHTQLHASPRALRRYLAGHRCQARRIGCGPWTVIERTSGGIIGFGGLYDDPFDPGWGIEVGYFFAAASWGKGYASELVGAALVVARERLGLGRLRAFAHSDNAGSRRVLAKAGFREVRFVPEMDRILHETTP